MRDWVGFWYEVARERGQNHISSLGRGFIQDSASGQVKKVEYFDFAHQYDDGISAVNKAMARLGNQKQTWPSAKNMRTSSLLQTVGAIRQALKTSAGRNSIWKQHQICPPGELHDYASLALTVEQSKALRSRCTELNISVNQILAVELDRICRSLLLDSNQETKWLFPINMRGNLGPDLTKPNQVSYIPLILTPRTTAQEVKAQVRQAYADFVPWGNWCIYNVGRVVGENGVRRLSQRASERSFWMGTVSDMGMWSSDEGYRPLHADEVWFCAPPGSPSYPIGLTHMTFNERLCLSLKIHPSLQGSFGDFTKEQALAEIRERILSYAFPKPIGV